MSDGPPVIGNTRAIIRAVTVPLLHNEISDFINVLIPVINLSSATMKIAARNIIV